MIMILQIILSPMSSQIDKNLTSHKFQPNSTYNLNGFTIVLILRNYSMLRIIGII